MSRRRPSLLLLALVVAAAFAAAAAAEMPSNRDAPTISEAGGPIVGETLLGNNGTWLYADGSPCRGECEYAFAWQRCVPGGDCASIPGGTERVYRVAAADAGRSLRVAVTATKYDCNAHGQDCRHVSRTAVSPQTAPVARPASTPVALTISSVAVERATRGRLAAAVRVVDAQGAPVVAARVTVRGASAVTRSDGWARIMLRATRAPSLTLSIRASKARAGGAALQVRIPIGR